MVKEQVPVPEQSPLQPINVDPTAGAADKVTIAPSGKSAVQVMPQSIPAGLEVTVPDPVPESVILKLCVIGPPVVSKFAVADLSASIVSEHVPVPEQSP